MDQFEQVVRAIVEGQIRSFVNDHPEVVEAVNWYKLRKDKKVTFVNSVAKRIVRDLTCASTRARLAAALVDRGYCGNGDNVGLELATGPTGGDVEVFTASPPC